MPDPSWLEVSLTVEDELAEPVAEVLRRFAPEGVVIESTAVSANPDDSEGHAVGPLRLSAYLPADEQLESTRRRLEEALWYLGRIRPLPAPQYRLVQQFDWAETWKDHFRPLTVGRRLLVAPPWVKDFPSGRIPLLIDPGMAFGTGAHPTTRLCLEMLEEVLLPSLAMGAETGRVSPPIEKNVIDLGCGSGILAIAALRLGASRALGVDIDPEALPSARKNAALNGVSDSLELALGSLEEILAGKFALRRAPLVLANILAPVLERLLDEGLPRLLTRGGSLVLSGILAEQSPSVEAALARHTLPLVSRRQLGDWVALRLVKPAS